MKKVENGCDDDRRGGRGAVRVLVVDDSPVDRKIVERLLLKSGTFFEVIAVDGGKKAMEVLGLNEDKDESPNKDERKIDVILTDYCMPKMNGYDLLMTVKKNARLSSIPVVIMSSENDPERIKRCRAGGAEDFILKPLQTVNIKRLRNLVRPEVRAVPTPLAGTKRKLQPEAIAEDNESKRRRPRLAGLVVS